MIERKLTISTLYRSGWPTLSRFGPLSLLQRVWVWLRELVGRSEER